MKKPIIAVAATLAKVAIATTGNIITTEVNGLSWTYQITSEENKTASLVYNNRATTISADITSEITIPQSINDYLVTSIGRQAFRRCNLSGIQIPSSVEIIGELAFSSCTNLKYVVLSDGLNNIAKNAFSGSAIESLTVPASVTNISDNAFSNCPNLSSLTVLGTATEISAVAFKNSNAITEVYMPETNESIATISLTNALSNISVKSLTKFDASCESFMTKLTPPTTPGGKWQITAFASVADGDASGLSAANVRVLCGGRADAVATNLHAKLAYVTNAVMVRLEFDRPDETVNYFKVDFGY